MEKGVIRVDMLIGEVLTAVRHATPASYVVFLKVAWCPPFT